ncbi:VanW family protein [Candidatus Berkelbacteria bacterium]|nr:VanW family protein [Candidatus Berkelbacteria bacterium]
MANSKTKLKYKLKHLPKWAIVSVSSLIALLVFSVGVYGFYSLFYAQKVFPNTQIGQLALGGMDFAQAEVELNKLIDDFYNQTLVVEIDGQGSEFKASTLKVEYDRTTSLERVLNVGRGGSVLENIVSQLKSLFYPNTIKPQYSYEQVALDTYLTDLSEKYDTGEVNPTIQLNENGIVINPAQIGQRYDQAALAELLTESLDQLTYPAKASFDLNDFQPLIKKEQVEVLLPGIQRLAAEPLQLVHENLNFEVTPEQIVEWLEFTRKPKEDVVDLTPEGIGLVFSDQEIAAYTKTLSDQIYKEPVDARLTIEDGRATVFQQSQNGYELDQDQAVAEIINKLISRLVAGIKTDESNQETVQLILPVKDVTPTVTNEKIEDLGIKELIGTGTTDFSGSPSNRVHNINNGTEFLKGLLIKPGEEFSTVGALGAVDASTGYLPELVIKENKTIPEYGGGLCQVSTTLFRAVLNAGLNVTERRNHSYRVSYYEREVGPGLDATVYLPKPDFKFINDTPGWILIQGRVKGRQLTFELYGTNDGRVATLDGPHTLWTKAPPPSEYIDDPSLAPGETRQIEHAHAGAKTTATYIVTRDGQEIHNQTFVSIYKALPAKYLRGPEAPAEEPPVEEKVEEAPQADQPPTENPETPTE